MEHSIKSKSWSLGVLAFTLSACGLSNAPVRSFVEEGSGIVDGQKGQEWNPETMPAPKPGTGTPQNGFDFEIRTQGPQRVVRGNKLIFSIQIIPKLGSLGGRSVSYTATGLPFEMRLKYPILESTGSIDSQAEAADHFAVLNIPLEASQGKIQLKVSATISGLSRTAEHFFNIEPVLKEIPTFTNSDSGRVIPYVEAFRKTAENFGAIHCESMNPSSNIDGIWTWDGLRAYELGGKAFSSKTMILCADKLRTFMEKSFQTNSFRSERVFTLGLESSLLRQGQKTTAEALKLAASHYQNLRPQSQEVLKSALGMMAMLSITRQKIAVTLPQNPWLFSESESLDLFLGHVDQLLISQNAPLPASLAEIGLLTETLIEIYALRPDPRIPHYLWVGLDRLWEANWQEKKVGMFSSFPNAPNKVVDLNQNLAIAGAYAWLFQVSGASKWQDRADALFEGGVRFGKFDDPALYSAQMRFAYDYLKWRASKPRTDAGRAF